jgi:membrane protein YdbS with pleckstrin-like domain
MNDHNSLDQDGCAAQSQVQNLKHHLDAGQAMVAGGTGVQPETRQLWTSSEGQVVNFWVFVLAAFTFWLVIPIGWAAYRYLVTAKHRYELTNQRLLEYSGVVVERVDTLELYRVTDIKVDGTFIQSLFGRGQVKLITNDKTTPRVTLNAIENPTAVLDQIRNAVEQYRESKRVLSLDV